MTTLSPSLVVEVSGNLLPWLLESDWPQDPSVEWQDHLSELPVSVSEYRSQKPGLPASLTLRSPKVDEIDSSSV